MGHDQYPQGWIQVHTHARTHTCTHTHTHTHTHTYTPKYTLEYTHTPEQIKENKKTLQTKK